LMFRGGDQTWHMESKEFGLWVQNSSFSPSYLGGGGRRIMVQGCPGKN
jgi:hypothetical protein